MQRLLRRSGYTFHTTAEKEVVRAIKEEVCYVAFNPQREEQVEAEHHTEVKEYTLPDGRIVKVGAERFRAAEGKSHLNRYNIYRLFVLLIFCSLFSLCCFLCLLNFSVLFNPSLIGSEYGGVHEVLANAIFKSDLDLRKTLFSQIVLAGGSTMFPGYGDRLLNEVRRLAQQSNCTDVKIRISAPPNRKLMTWTGGSILASLAAFKTMWVSKAEYDEVGASSIHRRTL